MGFRELFKTGIVAFGGFTLAETVYKPRYSIIGHWDADHVAVFEDVVIFAPLKPPRRIEDFVNRWYMQIPFNKLRAVCSIVDVLPALERHGIPLPRAVHGFGSTGACSIGGAWGAPPPR